jgi:rod shape determining protein RodA
MSVRQLDPWLLGAFLLIATCSFLAQNSTAQALDSPGFATRQLVWLFLGAGVVVVLGLSDYRVWARAAPALYALSLGLLAAMLVFAPLRAGTRSWIGFGSFGGQPSEVVRVVTILLIGLLAAEHRQRRSDLAGVVRLCAVVATPMVLIALQPDLGVSLTYLPILLAALWLGGLPWRVWTALLLAALALAGAAWLWYLKPYQRERVLTFLDSDRAPLAAGYQQRQSRIAVGAGGLTGRGLKSGTQSQLRFLPAQHTDFIFAVWAEETGFAGAGLLLAAYATLLMRIFLVAIAARDRLGAVIAGCVGSWLAAQTIFNLAMVLGLAPTTGITLPLLSYGGSSILATCLGLGLVQSIWRLRFANA